MKSPIDLMIALDVSTKSEADQLMHKLKSLKPVFKVGLELFSVVGPAWVKSKTKAGHRIFLDLKFHDIPHTVSKASVQAAEMGVEFFTVHLSGGEKMIKESQKALRLWSKNMKRPKPKMLGVSVLTSFDQHSWNHVLKSLGVSSQKIERSVLCLAQSAKSWGCEGMVCSPLELKVLKKFKLYKVTPGIRLESDAKGDQSRVMTPAQALQAGANAIVVGRPITQAQNPIEACKKYDLKIKEIR